MTLSTGEKRAVVYPDSDGQPMADNTVQYECIVTLKGNLDLLFASDPQVFVAGDLLWYPEEGKPEVRQAPDAMVVFGRPKGHRRSYKQWEEDGIAPQVVFEVWSPGNRVSQMLELAFYERYGVEEYYLYYPDSGEWDGWLRQEGRLTPVAQMEGWVSPRLGVRFSKGQEADVGLYYPDGRRFLSFMQFGQRAERLARLRELGIDPDQV